jgi:hypothetical protein
MLLLGLVSVYAIQERPAEVMTSDLEVIVQEQALQVIFMYMTTQLAHSV